MKLAIVAVLCTLVYVASAEYDVSGCKKFITALIDTACEKCPGDKVEGCKKCVKDGTSGGKMDVTACKTNVPKEHECCFELAPMLEGFDPAKLGTHFEKCMQFDVCAKLSELADSIKDAAAKAEESASSVTIDESCKNQAGDHSNKALEATKKLQDQCNTIRKNQGAKIMSNAIEALKTMFGITQDQVNSATTCISALTKETKS